MESSASSISVGVLGCSRNKGVLRRHPFRAACRGQRPDAARLCPDCIFRSRRAQELRGIALAYLDRPSSESYQNWDAWTRIAQPRRVGVR